MKNKVFSISKSVDELVIKIYNQWGHKHLYKDFQVLVDALELNVNLSEKEISSLDKLIGVLLREAKDYFFASPKWSSRCMDCATILFEYIPKDYQKRDAVSNDISELLTPYFTEPILRLFIRSEYYRKYIENAAVSDWECLGAMAMNCFRVVAGHKSVGSVEVEQEYCDLMVEGCRLVDRYLGLTHDFSRFSEWFSVLSPFKAFDLLDDFSSNFQGRYYYMVEKYLESTFRMQLALLSKWLDGDAEGFVDFWGAEKIEELLELVEDDAFFSVLEKLAASKNNAEVKKVLEYYSEDDEERIRNFALRLLEGN